MLKKITIKASAFYNRFDWLLIALLMAALLVGMSAYKINKTKQLPFFDARDGECFYWTESALHFRYARMAADGKTMPQKDIEIQYPEGLDTIRYETPVMEWVAGSLYHLLATKMPLHVFLIHFSCIFSTLSVLAIFFAGKFLWRSTWAGLISACFYSLAPASFARTAGAGFVREDFALPLVFFSFACFAYCLRRDRPLVAAAGTLFLAIALSAWHGTQFYVTLFVTGFVFIFLLRGSANLPRLSLTVFAIIMAIAAVALPLTRAKQFVFSPQMMTSYGLVMTLWLLPRMDIRKRTKQVFYGSAIILIFFIGGAILQKHKEGYSHIYGLFFDKIRYLGKAPKDGTKLSFDTKIEWSSGNVSPDIKKVFLFLGGTILLGTMGIVRSVYRIVKGLEQQGEIMAVYCAICTFLLFLLIDRFSVFTVFFLALLTGYLVSIKNPAAKLFSYVSMGICLILGIYILGALSVIPSRPVQECVTDVIHFIKKNTTAGEVVLTSFPMGPSIAAYAERPVILHSKFESNILRNKVEEIYTSLYRSEEEFYRVCGKYGAKLFVYQEDMVLKSNIGSIRYAVDAIPLKRDSTAALMHFAPERLKHFHLVHQNYNYRIFSIDGEALKEGANLQYEPIYDINIYCSPEISGQEISDSILASGYRRLQKPETHADLGDRFLSKGDYRTAISEYLWALALDSKHTRALQNLAEAMYKSGDVNDLPDANVWIVYGYNELTAGRYTRAEKFFRRALQLKPDSSEAYLRLGTSLFRLGRFREAEASLLRALSYNPEAYEAYETLGKVYTSEGAYGKAIEAIKKSLALNPNQPLLAEVLRELEKSERQRNIRRKN